MRKPRASPPPSNFHGQPTTTTTTTTTTTPTNPDSNNKSTHVPPFPKCVSLLAESDITLPAVIKVDNELIRPEIDMALFLRTEFRTPKLDALYDYLWLAGLPVPARPLLRQKLMNRTILPTERPDEHLVWHEGQIFIKPLPDYILCHAFWSQHICGGGGRGTLNPEIYTSAVGFLLSYAWLVQYPSDFAIAREMGLLPGGFDYAAWTRLIHGFISELDLKTLARVDRRYKFGELRLSRLSSLTRFRALFSGRNFLQGHINFSTRYTAFFDSNFGWLLAAFAFFSVLVSALQVGLAIDSLSSSMRFQGLSLVITLAMIAITISSAMWIFLIWLILLFYHLISTRLFVNKVEVERNPLRGGTA